MRACIGSVCFPWDGPEFYKTMRGIGSIDGEKYFPVAMILKNKICNSKRLRAKEELHQSHSYPQGVVGSCDCSQILTSFKKYLDECLKIAEVLEARYYVQVLKNEIST